MTHIQEPATGRPFLSSERDYPPAFAAITFGLVVLLMALAITSFVFTGVQSAATATRVRAATDTVDGWMPALTAASRQHRLDAAQSIEDGWAAALVAPRASTADGWEAVLVPQRAAAIDGYIQRFLTND